MYNVYMPFLNVFIHILQYINSGILRIGLKVDSVVVYHSLNSVHFIMLKKLLFIQIEIIVMQH